jgi:serine/threonine protein kinase
MSSAIPIPVFWSLLSESRLLAPEQCQQLATDFGQIKGAGEQSNAKTLAEWLVARNVLSRYQTMILLAGRPGPFHYGDYKVYDRIEKGRLAGCFRAVHGPTGHPVLLQFLTGAVIQNPDAWADAVQNTLAACAVHSPHVQRFFEPVDLGSFKFVVSEDLRGVTLDERLTMGRFPPNEACRLVRHAALGLAQLHQSGRAHGDIRPANLFLDTSIPGHPGDVRVLLDPHLVPGPINFASNDAKLTAMSDYLAPELMHAGRVPDALSDVYALGCTLYCLLTGSPPFIGGNVLQKMTRHASEGIRPLEPLGVPQPLAQLVTYMLAKNPQVRYQTPAIVAEQLAPFIDPALLYAQPPQPLPTQDHYEHWVLQKQAQLAAAAQQSEPEPEPAKPAFGLRIQEAGEAVVASKSKDGSPLAGLAVSGVPSSGSSRHITPMELAAKREKDQTRTVVTALVGVGAVAISLIILVYAMNQPKPTETTTTIVKKEEPVPPPVLQRIEGSGLSEIKPTPSTNNNGQATTNVSNNNVTPPPPGNQTPTESPAESGPTQQVVPDDGQLLWASPTAGTPVDFRMVPPEGQVFIVARPAEMLATGEGAKVLEALGPVFTANRTAWEKAAGLELSEIEQIIVTLHNNDAKLPRISYAVQTKNRLPSNDLLTRWGNPNAAKAGNNTYYTGQRYAFYIADAPQGTNSFVMGEATDIQRVTESGGAAPLLARDMARLLKTTDGDRHVNILFNPDFFDADDGEPLFQGVYAKTRKPLDDFLGDELEAGLVSMHFGPSFFLEARMIGQINRDRYALANDFRGRLKQMPDSVEQFLFLIDPPPYWKRVANRYRGMVLDLHDAMRVGVEGDQAVVNAYLPGIAAHNLVLGGELLVSSSPGAGPAVAVGPAAVATGPKTLEEVLALKSKMEFAAQSLEFVMNDVVADAQEVAKGSPFGKGGPSEFAIKVLGGDLEKDGITRNQTVRDFSKEGTIGEILTAIVIKANSGKPADDPDQKLIWVIGPDPDTAKQVVLITTKAAAATKKYNVPAVFQAKGK